MMKLTQLPRDFLITQYFECLTHRNVSLQLE